MVKLLDILKEVKLSRIYKHFNSDYPVGILSAYLSEKPEEQNENDTYKLMAKIRGAGYGYVPLNGIWKYEDGSIGQELSFLVIGNSKSNLKNDLLNWAKIFKQEAIVYKDTENKIFVLNQTGKELAKFTSVKFDKIADLYSSLRSGKKKGRTFTFENAYRELSWAEKLTRRN